VQPSITQQQRALELIDQGALHLRQGELDRAKAAFTVAKNLAPLPQALDGLGAAAFLAGDYAAAQRYFVGAYKLDPSYSEALANLAILYEALEFTKEAQILYRRAISENPENYRARNNFAASLYDHNKIELNEVRSELLRAEALVQHPLILDNLKIIEDLENGKVKTQEHF